MSLTQPVPTASFAFSWDRQPGDVMYALPDELANFAVGDDETPVAVCAIFGGTEHALVSDRSSAAACFGGH